MLHTFAKFCTETQKGRHLVAGNEGDGTDLTCQSVLSSSVIGYEELGLFYEGIRHSESLNYIYGLLLIFFNYFYLIHWKVL
jgi:hypothetical protein